MIRTDWNDERDKIISDNWGLLRTAKIAALLGVSRNAVIGRASRLGLKRLPPTPGGRPPNPNKPPRVKRIRGEHKIRKPPTREFASPPIPVAPLFIPFIDLAPHHCREVVGTGDYNLSLSCGHPRIEASSYCEFHHQLNYTTPAPRKVSAMRFAA